MNLGDLHWGNKYLLIPVLCALVAIGYAQNPFDFSPSIVSEPVRPQQQNTFGIVNDLLQDSLGRIWIASSEGLYRFDGDNFAHYTYCRNTTSSINSNQVLCLFLDSRGSLWVGTECGLNKYIPESDSFEKFKVRENNKSAPACLISALTEDARKNIWISTLDSGVFCLNAANGEFTSLHKLLQDGKRYLTVNTRTVFIDSDSTFWIGTTTLGVQYFNTKDYSLHILPRGAADGKHLNAVDIRCITQDSSGNLWFGGTTGGLTWYDPIAQDYRYFSSAQKAAEYIPSNTVWDLTVDSRNTLWVCTDGGGLLRYHAESENFEVYRKGQLASDILRLFYEDHAGNYWIGYYDAPLAFVNQGRRKFYRTDAFLGTAALPAENNITSLHEDSYRQLWIGTNGSGLLIYDPENQHIRSVPDHSIGNGLHFNKPLCFSEDPDGNMWIGYYEGGMSCYLRKQDRFVYYSPDGSDTQPKGLQVWGIHATDDAVWIGTELGVEKMDRKNGIFSSRIDTNGGTTSIFGGCGVIVEDSQGRILFGTHRGLYVYHTIRKELAYYHPVQGDLTSLAGRWVLSIFEDASKRIWIGTHGGGLNLWDGAHGFTAYSIENGLKGSIVKSIQQDASGNIWLSTNYGISSFSPRQKQFANYNIKDILPEGNFYDNAAIRKSDNLICFGSNQGIVYFKPDEIRPDTLAAGLEITEVSLTKRSGEVERWFDTHAIKHEVPIQPGDKLVHITFAVPSFSAAGRVNYKYMLDGRDLNWIDNGRCNFVNLSGLTPGRYRFKVMASNADGIWVQPPQELAIRVIAPWYRQTWLVVLVLFMVLTGACWWVARQIALWKQKSEQLLGQLQDRTRELEQRNLEIEDQTSKITHQRDVATAQRDQISKQKEELEKHRTRLEELVDERTQDLVAAKDMAEASDRLKTAFLQNLSHQIRTPMNAILGFINLLTEKIDDVISREYYLRIINESGRNMLALIHDIIDFGKMQAGELQPEYSECNASELIRTLVTRVREKVSRENTLLNILTELPPDDEVMFTDEKKLRQILTKLIDNALNSTSSGYIKTGIMSKTEDSIVFFVEDTGHGMEAGEEEHIFDHFYSGAAPAKIKDKNVSGLEPAFAKVAVELLGGKIWVERNPAGGATFLFTLPYMKVSKENKHQSFNAPETYKWAGKRILVAEDEDSNYLLIEAILKETKVELFHVTDGVELLEIIDKGEQKFDLILLDLKMPRMGGINAMKIIRDSDKDTPVIVQTAYDQTYHRDQCMDFGCNDFLVKPLRKRELLTAVKKFLG